jgi:hypothetical protein
LEQRRRPTAKFQNDFALYHAVAIKLKHPLKATLIDTRGEAETCRLHSGKIVRRAVCRSQLRNPGSRIKEEKSPPRRRDRQTS